MGMGTQGSCQPRLGSSCLCTGHMVLSFRCYLIYPGFLRICEHVTLSVSQEDNSRQGKTDQVHQTQGTGTLLQGWTVAGKGEGNQEAGRASKTVADPSANGPKALKVKLRW